MQLSWVFFSDQLQQKRFLYAKVTTNLYKWIEIT